MCIIVERAMGDFTVVNSGKSTTNRWTLKHSVTTSQSTSTMRLPLAAFYLHMFLRRLRDKVRRRWKSEYLGPQSTNVVF